MRVRDPCIWTVCCCFPGCVIRELDWKWNSQDPIPGKIGNVNIVGHSSIFCSTIPVSHQFYFQTTICFGPIQTFCLAICRVHIHTHIHTYEYIYTYIHIYLYTHTYTYMHTNKGVFGKENTLLIYYSFWYKHGFVF